MFLSGNIISTRLMGRKMGQLGKVTLLGLATLGLFSSGAASADKKAMNPGLVQVKSLKKTEVVYSSRKIATLPLTQMAKAAPTPNPARQSKLKAGGHPVAGDGSDYAVPNKAFPFPQYKQKAKSDHVTVDSVRQTRMPSANIPDPIVSFDGIPNVMNAVPPDTNGDVGPNHYVQSVNTALAVWDKQGNQLLAPVALNSLWSGLGGLCETTNRGDPIVLYDSIADRWLISQFAFNDAMNDNRQCIAISQTPDPTGAYYVYDFEFSSTHFNDYPKFGVWHDGYYMSVNQFVGNSYAGVAVVAYERSAMLNGAAARQVKIDLADDYPSLFSLLPADHDGVLAPPADKPNYFFAIQDDWFHEVSQDSVQIYNFSVDWNTPENSSFGLAQDMPVAAMDLNIETSEILQPNGVSLDSLRGYAMYRLAYRNYGNTASLAVNHNVDANSAGQAGVRWYQIDIDNNSNAISLAQQGTFAPDDGIDRWMGSAALDAVGNLAIGYNATSDSLHPSVYYAGRLAGDPDGELTQGETALVTGGGSQGAVDRSRWADYSSLSVDPVDDCTFWYTNEYYTADNNGTLAWSTRIGSFKFANCTALPTGFISGQVIDASNQQPLANIRVSAGGVATTTDPDGNYSLRLPENTYQLSFDSYWYQTQTFNNIAVTEDQTTTQNVSMQAAATVAVNGTVSDGGGKGWPLYSKLTFRVPNSNEIEVYTDPFDGSYSIDLVPGIALPVSIESQLNGYVGSEETITPSSDSANNTINYALQININECSAPGYQSSGLYQNFEGNFLNEGWASVDINDSGYKWRTTASGRSNVTGGSGEAALIDSDAAGLVTIDTALETPEIVVSELNGTTLTYLANFQTNLAADNFDLDIKVDAEDRWQNVLAWTGDHGAFAGPGESVTVDLSSFLTNVTTFKLRWHYYNANNEWFAQVDNVALGNNCVPLSGGSLIAGFVTDENTGNPINGVNLLAKTSGESFATAADSNVADGLFYVFADDTNNTLVASQSGYSAEPVELAIVNNQVVRQDLALSAAQLAVSPSPFNMDVPQGVVRDFEMSVENTGKLSGTYRVFELNTNGQNTVPMQGRFDVGARASGPKDLRKINAKHIRDYRPPEILPMAPGDVLGQFSIDRAEFAFGIEFDIQNNDFWIGSLSVGGRDGDDQLHRFTAAGAATSDRINLKSILSDSNAWFGDMAYNSRTGMIWVTEIDDENCIHEVDPATKAMTENKLCPEGISVGQQGLAYDPLSDTFFSGSWNDNLIHRFTSDGELLSSINTGIAVAGLAFHPVSNKLYVSVSAAAPEFDVVVLNANDYSIVGGFNVMQDTNDDDIKEDVMTDFFQGGMSLSCDGRLWVVDYDRMVAFQIDVEETDACSWGDVAWLNALLDGEVAAEETGTFTVQVDTTSLTLNSTHQAALVVQNSSPYGNIQVPMTVNVVDSVVGELGFSNAQIELTEEQTAQISVTRIDGQDGAISVDYTTVNGSAIAGTDYTETSGTLNWADNESGSQVIEVPILTVHQNKNFSIQLSNPSSGVSLTENSRLEVSIIDKPKGSGAISAWALLLLVFAGLRIKKQIK